MKLKDKSIVVTGAVAGIGAAITELFVREGANVIAVDKQEERLMEMCKTLEGPGRAVPFPGNVAFQSTTDGMIDAAVAEFGTLDVLVNNAGVMDDNTAVGDMSDEMMDEVFAVNTFGPMRAMRKAVNTFFELNPDAEEDDETIGSIINITSVGALHQTAGASYCASKAALLAATKNTSFMYIHKGIRVNAIAPGGIVTELPITMPTADEFGFGRTSELLVHSSLLGMPEDIANAALFLAQDESHFINGAVIAVDGAWTTF